MQYCTRGATIVTIVKTLFHMDIASAARTTLACAGRYRLPEPTRAAHQLVQRARRNKK